MSPIDYIANAAIGFPKQTVGTTRQTLLGASDRGARTVIVSIDRNNTGYVFLGDNTVTSAGGGNVFAQLGPGDKIILPIGNTNDLNIVGNAAGQVYYVGVLA